MSTFTSHAAFIDRTGAHLRQRGALWVCRAGRLSASGLTATAAIASLRELVTTSVVRLPVTPARWLTPR